MSHRTLHLHSLIRANARVLQATNKTYLTASQRADRRDADIMFMHARIAQQHNPQTIVDQVMYTENLTLKSRGN